jgi:hypothetical protein
MQLVTAGKTGNKHSFTLPVDQRSNQGEAFCSPRMAWIFVVTQRLGRDQFWERVNCVPAHHQCHTADLVALTAQIGPAVRKGLD